MYLANVLADGTRPLEIAAPRTAALHHLFVCAQWSCEHYSLSSTQSRCEKNMSLHSKPLWHVQRDLPFLDFLDFLDLLLTHEYCNQDLVTSETNK